MATFDLGKFGISLEGDYSDETTYEKLSQVRYDGASWLSIKQTTGNTPSENSEYWQKVVNDGPDAPSTIRNKTNITLDTSGWTNHEYDLSDDLETLSDENINILDIELDSDTATAVQSQEYKDSVLFPKTDAKKIFSVVTPSQDIPIILTYNNLTVRDEVDFDFNLLREISWSNATADNINILSDLINANAVTLEDFFSIGEERNISLAGLNPSDDNACFVIMHRGGNLFKDVNNNYVLYIVGLKHCLSTTKNWNADGSGHDSYGWTGGAASGVRNLCNSIYNVLPDNIKPIFKQFYCQSNALDYFVIPNYNEINTFDWYKTTNNRKKKIGGGSDPAPETGDAWWTRDNTWDEYDNSEHIIDGNGNYSKAHVNTVCAVSPFGCI